MGEGTEKERIKYNQKVWDLVRVRRGRGQRAEDR